MFPVHDKIFSTTKSTAERFGHVAGGAPVFGAGAGSKKERYAGNNNQNSEHFFHKFWIWVCVKIENAIRYLKRFRLKLYCSALKGRLPACAEMTKFVHEQAANLPGFRTNINTTITESIFHEIRTATSASYH